MKRTIQEVISDSCRRKTEITELTRECLNGDWNLWLESLLEDFLQKFSDNSILKGNSDHKSIRPQMCSIKSEVMEYWQKLFRTSATWGPPLASTDPQTASHLLSGSASCWIRKSVKLLNCMITLRNFIYRPTSTLVYSVPWCGVMLAILSPFKDNLNQANHS